MPDVEIRRGRFGRVFFVRLRPNIDLVEGLEAACAENGLAHAVLRGSIGSVNYAVLETGDGTTRLVDQPGLEILSLKGVVEPGPDGSPRALVTGSMADEAGTIHAGRFRRGENPICITAEVCLEEWIPQD